MSPVTGHSADYTLLLGERETDPETGEVIAAKSALTLWRVEFDPEKIERDRTQLFGIEYKTADPFTMQWEAEVIRMLEGEMARLGDEDDGYKLLLYFQRRYGYVAGARFSKSLLICSIATPTCRPTPFSWTPP